MGVSRQRLLQKQYVAEGNCKIRRKPRNLYADTFDWHGVMIAGLNRRRLGLNAWRPGKPGRPPLWSKRSVDMSTEKRP